LSTNIVEHEREVVHIEDFLGSIAGIYDLLLLLFIMGFGNYLSSESKID